MNGANKNVRFMQGNHACAEGALAAGCNFFAGYPITPSSEIAELMSLQLPKSGGVFIQMEDEIAAMACVIGAALGGAKSLTATSGPGFSLKQENLGFACMTEIPCVVVNVMRGGPSTGLPTMVSQADVMQARWGTHGDHPTIALAPSTIPEIFYQTVRAFNLSEKYRTPVILLMDEIIGHMREKMIMPEPGEIEIVPRKKPTVSPDEYSPYEYTEDLVPPLANFGEGYRFHVTGLNHDMTGFPTNDNHEIGRMNNRKLRKLERYRDEIVQYETEAIDDCRKLIVAYGSTARSAMRATRLMREQGDKVGFFKPMTLWPFPDKELEEIASRADLVLVPELNLGQMILEVERAVHGKARVVGLNKVDGEPIAPQLIVQKLKEF
ncbi:2-oxoacid:acceptor oxidoreductase subunit alpha [bacterium]|nr:2-oxoacid:acceptor oxidoreductase subunit alpha [bacterium]